jgi:2-dehydropantoate 2-reductase
MAQIAVMGAGAVGCYYGGMLARAGHTVTLIGRQQHVDAIQRDGLLLDTQAFTEHVPLRASTDPGAVAGATLVLFCVKSTDTESAAALIRQHLLSGTLVLTLQNGVDNALRLQAALPQQEVAASVVYVATAMAGPGHVRHHGRGELVIATSASSMAAAALLVAAGVPTEISSNVEGALWAKLILNCAYNALSAITRQPYGRLVQAQGVPGVLCDVVNECLAVAQADGITVPGDVAQAVERIAQTMPGQLSSTAQDLARGKRSEIDYLNGYVLRRGEALGVATPVNRVLWTLVKLMEDAAPNAHP